RFTRHESGFVAGLSDSFTLTEHAGVSRGLQVNFTPFGARLCFGVPMEELTNRAVGLDELLGAEGAQLTVRLAEARDWPARFALLDRMLVRRLLRARPIPAWVQHAYRCIEQSGGQLDIG